MMKTLSTDVAVIGAGTAGLNAVEELQDAGLDWRLIEQGPYGTTCARFGCMPSKLLIAAADAAHAVQQANTFGIEAGRITIHGSQVMQRVRALRDDFVSGVVEKTCRLPDDRRLHGLAKFVDQSTLCIDDSVHLKAKAFVIAVGSEPRSLSVLDAISESVITSNSVFELDDIPRRLAVIGSGPVGLELGVAFARLGSQVTLISNGSALGTLSDPEVTMSARQSLGNVLDLHLDCDLESGEPHDDAVKLTWTDQSDNRHHCVVDRVLVAAGRRSRLEDMRPERAGIELDSGNGRDWDMATTRYGKLPIFIAGDASDERPLLHEAVDEGRIAGRNAAKLPDVTEGRRRTPLSIVFTSPQIATVGKAFRELDQDELIIGSVSFENQGRARIMAENAGMLRLYASKADATLLGAELFAPQAEHLAHLLAWACQRAMTVPEMLALPVYHPVLEEGLSTALRDIASALPVERPLPCENRGTSVSD